MFRFIVSQVFLLVSTSLFAGRYVVLFSKTAETSRTGEDRVQDELINVNAANVKVLESWMTDEKAWAPGVAAVSIEDLWIAQAALVEIADEKVEDLRKQPFVEDVIKDFSENFLTPAANDLEIHAGNTPTSSMSLWGLNAIRLNEARRSFPNATGEGVKVGIIDTGIESNHVQFQRVQNVMFKDFVNGLPNAYDDHGHGSHVAGTISGTATGIAPKATFIVAKALGALGGGTLSGLLAAMQWVANPDGNPQTKDGAKIVSNSWGAHASSRLMDAGIWSPFERVLFNWVAMGMIPVFAAGNGGTSAYGIPGFFPATLAVAATQENGAIAYFSSRGPVHWIRRNFIESVFKPDLAAPGHRVTSAFPGGQYATWSGTSMATPHVSGALALAVQLKPNMNFKLAKLALISSANTRNDLNFGAGILDLPRLLQVASRMK